ncbi:hypothetical protein RMATCC62417_09277 [Rhizopus microsporus]|nr:hypothetical protein RMATCC62417_09277 [Rhizopus microsporus]
MGQQQSSKLNEPFTFGYISQPQEPDTTEPYTKSLTFTDFILNHPDLYKLEENSSILHRNLENDLNYIDQTYYNTEEEEDDEEDYTSIDDETYTLRDEEGWSRLTAEQVMSHKRMTSFVDLSNQSLIKLSSSIAYLSNLTKLDLSNNLMINLPRAIGQLVNLRVLNASKNQLEFIPDTIQQLKRLNTLILSENKLTTLPKGIGNLPQLAVLLLDNNQLAQLPQEISQLSELMTLNVSHNPLRAVPAEIASLKSLKKLLTEECSFDTECSYPLMHDPPSLFEICARQITQLKIPIPYAHIAEYLKKKKVCSFCSGPYFESFVSRKRFVERVSGEPMALDYTLCTAHWTNEDDRLLAMFSTGSQLSTSQDCLVEVSYNSDPESQNEFEEGIETTTSQDQSTEDFYHRESLNIPSSDLDRSNSHSSNSASSESHALRQPDSFQSLMVALPFIHTTDKRTKRPTVKQSFAQLGSRLATSKRGSNSRGRSETL